MNAIRNIVCGPNAGQFLFRANITYPATTSSSLPRSATAGARWIAGDAARLARPLAHTEVEHIDRWGILPNWGSQFDDFPQAFSGYDLFPRSPFPYGGGGLHGQWADA